MKKTKISTVLGTLYYFSLFVNVAESAAWSDNLTKYIAEDSGYREVCFITISKEKENFKNYEIQNLIVKISNAIPTKKAHVNELFDDYEKFDKPGGSDNPNLVGAAATIFVLIHEPSENSSTEESKMLIDAAAELSAYHYHPLFLFLSGVRKPSVSLEKILHYAWSKQLLDVTVVEILDQDKMTNLRKPEKNSLPIIHQINPFKKEYKRENWPSETKELFPNKVKDLNGHRLTYGPGQGYYPRYAYEYFPTDLLGERLMTEVLKKMNGSLSLDLISEMKEINEFDSVYDIMERENYDIWIEETERFSIHRNNTLRTVATAMDQFCAIAPKVKISNVGFNERVFKAYALCALIIFAFWVIKRIFKFDDPFWHSWNIGCVLFGVSAARLPRQNIQRIIFCSLVTISVVYSSDIYNAATDFIVKRSTEKNYESFEDLDNSNLPVLIDGTYHNFERIFSNDSAALLNLRKKANLNLDNKRCRTEIGLKNQICLTRLRDVQPEMKIDKGLGSKIQIAKPCFWTNSAAFIVRKRSPYRAEFDKWIMRLQETGIYQFHYDMWLDILRRMQARKEATGYENDKPEDRPRLSYQLLILLGVGYTIAIFAFLMELLWFHVLRKLKMDKIKTTCTRLFVRR